MQEHDANAAPMPVPEGAPSRREIAAPLLALGLAALYWASFSLLDMESLPGLGVFAFVAAYFACVFILLGPKTTFRPGGIFLAAASLVLGLGCALYSLPGMTVLNCFVILATAATATFSLSGQAQIPLSRAACLGEAVCLSLSALFTRLHRPFQTAARLSGPGVRTALLTAAGAAALLGAVGALLASADPVFASLFARLSLPESWGMLLWRAIRTVGLALFIASGLYFIREAPPRPLHASGTARTRQALPFAVIALLLDAVYLLFCAIQIKYLFGGAEAAAMAGGWAAYARSGFFQLAAVAAINLALCLLPAQPERFAAKGGLLLRAADGLMLALTAVILLSAARRMQLYILAYGLSVLRLMTIFLMAAMGLSILAAAWKLIRPGFSFFQTAGAVLLTLWCLFCLANPGGLVARYNVAHYLSGQLEEMDVYYLETSIGADALPALERLASQAEPGSPAAEEAENAAARLRADSAQTGRWSEWKLSLYLAGKK